MELSNIHRTMYLREGSKEDSMMNVVYVMSKYALQRIQF
jgi:hypothetical protein